MHYHEVTTVGGLKPRRRNSILATEKAIIDEADARKIATNWFVGMGVDIKRLEMSSVESVERNFFWSNYVVNGDKVLLPIFKVMWFQGARADNYVEIDGRDKEPLKLHVSEDMTLTEKGWRMSKMNLEALKNISDDTLKLYSDYERKRLVSNVFSKELNPNLKINCNGKPIPALWHLPEDNSDGFIRKIDHASRND